MTTRRPARKIKDQKIKIDLTQLEPLDSLEPDEKALHRALQKGEFIFDGSEKTLEHYAEIFANSSKQRQAISLRIPTQDYLAIKAKAAEQGLPYQALINSVIHRYITGALKEAS